MNKDVFRQLARGDIIRHKLNGESHIVTGNYGNRITAVRTVDMTNPDEWDLILLATWFKNEYCSD